MQIDKTKFLFLVSASLMATGAVASGCTITTNSSNTPDAATPESDSGSTSDARPLQPDASEDGSRADAFVSDGGACLGRGSMPAPDCEGLAVGAKACYVDGIGLSACFVISTSMKNEIAADAVECIRKLDECPFVEAPLKSAVRECVEASAAKACEDSQAEAPCQAEIDRCVANGITPDINKAQCVKALSALNAAGIAEFKTCTTDRAAGCSLANGQYSCLNEYLTDL
jgi:hypothetical protein